MKQEMILAGPELDRQFDIPQPIRITRPWLAVDVDHGMSLGVEQHHAFLLRGNGCQGPTATEGIGGEPAVLAGLGRLPAAGGAAGECDFLAGGGSLKRAADQHRFDGVLVEGESGVFPYGWEDEEFSQRDGRLGRGLGIGWFPVG
jgi:hypothetical protein